MLTQSPLILQKKKKKKNSFFSQCSLVVMEYWTSHGVCLRSLNIEKVPPSQGRHKGQLPPQLALFQAPVCNSLPSPVSVCGPLCMICSVPLCSALFFSMFSVWLLFSNNYASMANSI